MAFSRAFIARNSLLMYSSLSSSISLLSFSSIIPTITTTRSLTLSASVSSQQSNTSTDHSSSFPLQTLKPAWKPMCLYYTQGKCTFMDDPSHLDKFNHSCSVPLEEEIAKSEKLRPQDIDFLLVLDLEGKVEILEFPVLIIDAKTLQAVDFFHRFVRPSNMSEKRIEEYIEGKYGKLGVSRVWHDTAMPFREVIQEFEAWITGGQLWEKELGGPLHRAAFVTCGNWDIKTKIPQQCQVCSMKIPPYFFEWINLKDIYLNFYNRRATGMRTMLNELKIPLLGSHHLEIDDTKNIARVVQRMLADGAVMSITAKRKLDSPESVDFLFKNRIR
ncbi:putative exonuclease domain-containing protein At3g15140 [Silene latifolia]|uniref:putative exonuclease domain-containing protein At3g15140 n=1 Tax=Silene latifolia TaxID=37657 RepID=UPI003D76A492